ncbi:hypothetical protein GGF42_000347 [Coemansia sp. RSA 2424]|nr:hypothetical protein GGF42_000347 [Coemansia sp. RSA 2424]
MYRESLVPVRAPLVQGCTLDINSIAARSSAREARADLAVVVVWQEAVDVGCFTFAQIHQLLVNAGSLGKGAIRGVVFGSAVDSRYRAFGSPLVEPYGDLEAHNSIAHVMLVADYVAKSIVDHLPSSSGASNATLAMLGQRSPWDALFASAGFSAQKYIFLSISGGLVLYTLWETALALCTPTAWDQRMLMYIAAIAYLVVFTVLQPYNAHSRALQMAAYASWIVGYIIFTLFTVAWGAIVEKLHSEETILRHQSMLNYGAAIVVSLSVLIKLWAFAAESYQFLMIANLVIAYEVPVIFSLQTALLGYLVWSFLRRTTIIAISRHTKKALRNVTVLCVVAIIGCACIIVMSIVMASPARFTVAGYVAAITLYKLGQCLMLASIFAVLWVREHARRTRPQICEHEFYVDIESSCIRPSGHASRVTGSQMGLVGRGLAHNDSSLVYGLSKPADYTYEQSFLTSGSLARIQSGSSSGTDTQDACLSALHVALRTPQHLLDDHAAIAGITRKHSKRHVYVPLEPLSNSQMQRSNSKRLNE